MFTTTWYKNDRADKVTTEKKKNYRKFNCSLIIYFTTLMSNEFIGRCLVSN